MTSLHLTKPPALEPGDIVAIISPSAPAAGKFTYRLDRAKAQLESMGLVPRIMPNSLGMTGYVSASAAARAADIHAAFTDSDVKGVIAAIGGEHCCHLLPLLDFALLGKHPKVFVGYSDVSVLLLAMHTRCSLVTFYGPTIMTDFAEKGGMPQYSCRHFRRVVAECSPPGHIEPASERIDEFIQWGTEDDTNRRKSSHPSAGWTCLREGRANGPLLGGCIESLMRLRGTPFWPRHWDGAILFLETSAMTPNLPALDAMLMDFENMGIMHRIAGLMFGRKCWPAAATMALHQLLLARSSSFSFPILADMDFGHVLPMFTIPIGCVAHLDSARHHLSIEEAAVATPLQR